MPTRDKTLVVAAIAATGNDIYALADLDEPIWSMSRWWVDDDLTAYVLSIDGFDPPVLYLNGNAASAPLFGDLLERVADQLPDELYANVIVGAEASLASFSYRPVGTYQRMEVASQQPMPLSEHDIEVFTSSHFDEIVAFFADARADANEHLGEFFSQPMLDTGFYRGVRLDGQLVAVAGVHVASSIMAVASIGNVAVHHRYRGLGLGAVVTVAVVKALRDNNITRIGLNVDVANTPAVRTYERLGFVTRYRFTEGPATRRQA
jgi:ribosomal protein S18 acetylase RimI-like enzyme